MGPACLVGCLGWSAHRLRTKMELRQRFAGSLSAIRLNRPADRRRRILWSSGGIRAVRVNTDQSVRFIPQPRILMFFS